MTVYLVPNGPGHRIVIDKAIIFVGRLPDCDVVLTRSRKVSRRHCCFAQVNNQLMIRDLGSMNGVRVNGKRVDREMRISVGDEVSIGDLSYMVKSKSRDDEDEPQVKANGKPPVDDESPFEIVEDQEPRRQDSNVSRDFPVPVDDDFEPLPIANRDGYDVGERAEDDLYMLEDSSEQ